MKNAQASAEITGPCGDTMKFWLRILACRIINASFITDGCNTSIASGSMTARLVEEKSLEEARHLTPEQVLSALGGLPPDHEHCPVLAVNTVKAAIANYHPENTFASAASQDAACASPASDPTHHRTPLLHSNGRHGLLPKQEEAVLNNLRNVSFKLVVLSGKGGVGKSTIAANLAVALAEKGVCVGLLDVDIHGPSIPKILGIENARPSINDQEIQPIQINPCLKVMSLGLLLSNAADAVIWRGPMKYGVIQELLSAVSWGSLDVLVVDAPPGTGDEPLAIAQLIGRPAAAIVVTTPQQLAITDVRRSITFCTRVSLPVLGLVENMSGFCCPKCLNTTDIFKSGGGAELAAEMNIPCLGSIPIDAHITHSADNGTPFAIHDASPPVNAAFAAIAEQVYCRLSISKPNKT